MPQGSGSRHRRGGTLRKVVLGALCCILGTAEWGCGGGGGSKTSPPPPPSGEWFFVGNGSGIVTGFSAASGRLEPIPGSSANFALTFPTLLTTFAVEPRGTFMAVIFNNQSGVTLQIADVASGGAITPQPLTTTTPNTGGVAISSTGVAAVTDSLGSSVQLMAVQGNLFFQGGSAATGPAPQDLVFSADGKTLYVGNTGDGSISAFSVADNLTLQPLQTAQLYNLSGVGVAIARVRVSPSGKKFAASTSDGVLYVADVSSTDQTLSNVQIVPVGIFLNLQEVLFDPSERYVYTADQDNGGIYGYALVNGGAPTPLAGSPFSTGSLPGGPTGMAFNSSGDRLYAVMGALGVVITYERDSSGKLSATGDSVGTGGLLANGIARVPAH